MPRWGRRPVQPGRWRVGLKCRCAPEPQRGRRAPGGSGWAAGAFSQPWGSSAGTGEVAGLKDVAAQSAGCRPVELYQSQRRDFSDFHFILFSCLLLELGSLAKESATLRSQDECVELSFSAVLEPQGAF